MLVEKALHNLEEEGALALAHDFWPLTLKDIDPRIFRHARPLIFVARDKAIGFLGIPGAGKTPWCARSPWLSQSTLIRPALQA